MRNLTRRQRVLRRRVVTRLVAKQKRAEAKASFEAFAEANPAVPLKKHSKGMRTRNMRQVVAGDYGNEGQLGQYVATLRQLLEVQQQRNDAATSMWQMFIAKETEKRNLAKLELKPI